MTPRVTRLAVRDGRPSSMSSSGGTTASTAARCSRSVLRAKSAPTPREAIISPSDRALSGGSALSTNGASETTADRPQRGVHVPSTCVVCGSTDTRLSRADLADFEYKVHPELPLVADVCRTCGSEYLSPRP